jgi:hypothetical protein
MSRASRGIIEGVGREYDGREYGGREYGGREYGGREYDGRKRRREGNGGGRRIRPVVSAAGRPFRRSRTTEPETTTR